MKATLFITLTSVIASLATATLLEKDILCTEACWAYDNANHDSCKENCINGQVWGLGKAPFSFCPGVVC
jgi:hypothetical protein